MTEKNAAEVRIGVPYAAILIRCQLRSAAQSITPPVTTDSQFSWTYAGGNSWSPDGEWIVTGTLDQLQVVNVKTGLTLPLPWSFDYSAPDWKPR